MRRKSASGRRMVLDHEKDHALRWATVVSIAAKIGCAARTLHEWVKKAEVNSGRRAGVPSDVAAQLKALKREDRELRQAIEILRKASPYFAQAELDRPFKRLSHLSTTSALSMGSSRPTKCCRSLQRPTMRMSQSGIIHRACRRGRGAMPRSGSRCGACSMRTSASTVYARSGGDCGARDSMWPALSDQRGRERRSLLATADATPLESQAVWPVQVLQLVT